MSFFQRRQVEIAVSDGPFDLVDIVFEQENMGAVRTYMPVRIFRYAEAVIVSVIRGRAGVWRGQEVDHHFLCQFRIELPSCIRRVIHACLPNGHETGFIVSPVANLPLINVNIPVT